MEFDRSSTSGSTGSDRSEHVVPLHHGSTLVYANGSGGGVGPMRTAGGYQILTHPHPLDTGGGGHQQQMTTSPATWVVGSLAGDVPRTVVHQTTAGGEFQVGQNHHPGGNNNIVYLNCYNPQLVAAGSGQSE